MEYFWEKRVREQVTDAADELDIMLPDKYCVVGICVVNKDLVEAALLRTQIGSFGEIADADIWEDIMFDAQRHFELYHLKPKDN